MRVDLVSFLRFIETMPLGLLCGRRSPIPHGPHPKKRHTTDIPWPQQKREHQVDLYVEGGLFAPYPSKIPLCAVILLLSAGAFLHPLHRISQLVCDKMMPRLEFTFPSWLPGFLSYCESLDVSHLMKVAITDPVFRICSYASSRSFESLSACC